MTDDQHKLILCQLKHMDVPSREEKKREKGREEEREGKRRRERRGEKGREGE